MAKWIPFAVIPSKDKEQTLAALRKNKPKYSWRTKKATGMAGMFAFLRVEKRRKK